MKILKTFVLGFLIFTLLNCTKTTAIAQNEVASSSVPGQIIVKFKTGQSGEELTAEIRQRRQDLQTGMLLTTFKIILQDVAFKLAGNETPEYKLYQLVEAEQKAGVISKKELFSDDGDASLHNFFQLKLNLPSDTQKAIDIFRNLPEVEFAEPNYLGNNEGI